MPLMSRRTLLTTGGAAILGSLALPVQGKSHKNPPSTRHYLRATLVSPAFSVPITGARFIVPYNTVVEQEGDITFNGGQITVPDGLFVVNAGVAFQSESPGVRARWLSIGRVGSDVRFPLVQEIDQDSVETEVTDAAMAASTVFKGPGSLYVWVSDDGGGEYVAPIAQTFFEAARIDG